jgi:hypothetical protein
MLQVYADCRRRDLNVGVRLTRLSDDTCNDGKTCPAVYATDRTDPKTRVVQGYTVTDPETLADLQLGPGESAVEIPVRVLPPGSGADRTDEESLLVRGESVTDPYVLAQLTLASHESAVEVRAEEMPGGAGSAA